MGLEGVLAWSLTGYNGRLQPMYRPLPIHSQTETNVRKTTEDSFNFES